ncbi:DUF302 domain-containing protein [Tropicimonas sp. TH_r6]|uniref:DUF302 domain-containing protein n=1 Tax=Tropicimonas sp. TH_r6 TaxID=3082085 RepID=UPI00295482D9|nr:DUF302 domain-containing protein [Tropicimonas sp. TH_r6]MDV7143425.1 DUF302 domain-containing protein [Tropicimonas sp. TH_r6]
MRILALSSVLATAILAFSTIAKAEDAAQAAVDTSFDAIKTAVLSAGYEPVIDIDHARLAAEAGEEMPPSRVQLFSNPEVEAQILQQDIRAGLDLPFRVLSFAEQGQAKVIYTDADFLAIRHGLDLGATGEAFDTTLTEILEAASVVAEPAPTEGIVEDFGIIELTSAHDFETTIDRLKQSVMAQGDTIWFGEVDFTAQVAATGVDLAPTTLLLFGGPAPGGVAMAQFPAIGLDAFCQKLLVYTADDGSVKVIFNDIAALAELHYGTSAKPHHGLNQRLTETFTGAVN